MATAILFATFVYRFDGEGQTELPWLDWTDKR